MSNIKVLSQKKHRASNESMYNPSLYVRNVLWCNLPQALFRLYLYILDIQILLQLEIQYLIVSMAKVWYASSKK